MMLCQGERSGIDFSDAFRNVWDNSWDAGRPNGEMSKLVRNFSKTTDSTNLSLSVRASIPPGGEGDEGNFKRESKLAARLQARSARF